jgi:hypothetical protein
MSPQEVDELLLARGRLLGDQVQPANWVGLAQRQRHHHHFPNWDEVSGMELE